jgi:hypothetical protein
VSDNEKRAHDLAMLFWQQTYANAQSRLHKNLELYDAYKQTYDIMLENLNRDFPNGI